MRGGKREGAGRKIGWRKGFSSIRPQHQIRAFPDEWEYIKRFAKIVKHGDKEACAAFIDEHDIT